MAVSKHRPKKPRRITPAGALRIVDPAKWARAVKQAMRAAGGRVPEAAKALGVSRRQLYRWLMEPAFADVARAPVGLHRD
jgi:transcriptional regulator with PAS, ATPase and Fis domain